MRKLRITFDNKSYDVTVEDLTESSHFPTSATPMPQRNSPPAAPLQPAQNAAAKPTLPIAAGAVTSPMAGVIKSILVQQADTVKQSQPLVILDAMKMENQITAPIAGTVMSIDVAVGDSVQEAQVLLVLE